MLRKNWKKHQEAAAKITSANPSPKCSDINFHTVSRKPQGKGIKVQKSGKIEKQGVVEMPMEGGFYSYASIMRRQGRKKRPSITNQRWGGKKVGSASPHQVTQVNTFLNSVSVKNNF